MDRHAFGTRIRQARAEQNFTSDMLASACNINPVFVRQIESGIRLPSIENFVLFCNVLQVSPTYLLGADLACKKDDTALEGLINSIKALSPKQLEMINSTATAMIDCMD